MALPKIQKITVIGLNLNVTNVQLGQKNIPFAYDVNLKVLKVNVDLTMPQNFILKWK